MDFPRDDEHHAVYGMNGSGKTVFALWCLSRRSFDRMPWTMIDFKRDSTIAEIPRVTEVSVRDKPPKAKGLYVVRPDPADVDDGAMTDWLYGVWRNEHHGLLIDEGYMLNPRDKALRAVLTQGRSKRTPVIALSQRPSWVSPFIHSESNYKSAFFLQMPADIDKVREWLPPCDPASLKPYHSYWYNVKKREFAYLAPCPSEQKVLDLFDSRRVRRYYI